MNFPGGPWTCGLFGFCGMAAVDFSGPMRYNFLQYIFVWASVRLAGLKFKMCLHISVVIQKRGLQVDQQSGGNTNKLTIAPFPRSPRSVPCIYWLVN